MRTPELRPTRMSLCCWQVCRLQAELARLRSQVERGEAQQVELRYQLSLHQREGERERWLREEEQQVQQQEVEERHALMEHLTSENQRLHQLLQVCVSRCPSHAHTLSHRHTLVLFVCRIRRRL